MSSPYRPASSSSNSGGFSDFFSDLGYLFGSTPKYEKLKIKRPQDEILKKIKQDHLNFKHMPLNSYYRSVGIPDAVDVLSAHSDPNYNPLNVVCSGSVSYCENVKKSRHKAYLTARAGRKIDRKVGKTLVKSAGKKLIKSIPGVGAIINGFELAMDFSNALKNKPIAQPAPYNSSDGLVGLFNQNFHSILEHFSIQDGYAFMTSSALLNMSEQMSMIANELQHLRGIHSISSEMKTIRLLDLVRLSHIQGLYDLKKQELDLNKQQLELDKQNLDARKQDTENKSKLLLLQSEYYEYQKKPQAIKDLDGNIVATTSPREAMAINNIGQARKVTDENNFELDDRDFEDLDIDFSPLSQLFFYETEKEIFDKIPIN